MKFDTIQLCDIDIEVIDGDRGKNYPHQDELLKTGDCLFLSAKNVTKNGFSFTEKQFITKEKDKLLNNGRLKRGDIVITTRGTVGNVALYSNEICYDKIRINSGMLIIRCGDKIDNYYLYQVLRSKWFQNQILSIQSGSAQPQLPKSHFHRMTIPVPDVNTQHRIASILSIIDEKIVVNTAINENIEQQAQAIFKSWFVDFEPFGGVMPDDWNTGNLGSFVTIKRGGSPRPIQNYLSETGYRWLKISDVTSLNSPFILDIKEHIIESGLKKTVFLKQGALVFSNSATPGIPKILDVDSCIHDGWLYFPESKLSNEYLYLLFKFIRKDLVALGNGSVFTNLKTDILKQYEISLPSERVLNDFQTVISPLFEAMRNIARENKSLAALRDTLLPKLMNGEIDVTNVRI